MGKSHAKSDVRKIFDQIYDLSLEERKRLNHELDRHGFPYFASDEAEPLVIDNRFGPVEKRLLELLQNRDTDLSGSITENRLLRLLWPKDAPRILDAGGDGEQIRGLQQRLKVRIGRINDKLREYAEPWRIVRTRETDEATYYLGESEPDEASEDR